MEDAPVARERAMSVERIEDVTGGPHGMDRQQLALDGAMSCGRIAGGQHAIERGPLSFLDRAASSNASEIQSHFADERGIGRQGLESPKLVLRGRFLGDAPGMQAESDAVARAIGEAVPVPLELAGRHGA